MLPMIVDPKPQQRHSPLAPLLRILRVLRFLQQSLPLPCDSSTDLSCVACKAKWEALAKVEARRAKREAAKREGGCVLLRFPSRAYQSQFQRFSLSDF